MSDPVREHLRHLFERALALPAGARTAFLDQKCGTDADLKRRLLAMLTVAEGGDRPEPAPASAPAEAPREATKAPAQEGPGSEIGPYRLLQQIGEGGFGVVFLAEQHEPVARRVALKIVKLGMDTHEVVARFEQERQALALMDHPHIARVLDAGATVTGRPYFVMDLVKGAPIVEFCDQNRLTIEERLALFVQVCGAVQHAHGKGIIHRDLKPSNILVGSQDGRPVAKVIDFGIAKATSQPLTDRTLFTAHHQVVGTLQYMSPEQAEGSLDIDTRTDVYSLGVVLYELLTGSTPFDTKAMQGAMFGELQRWIRDTDPPRPSTRLSGSKATMADIAAHRRVEPRRLGSLLRGDLDWIVMKALEKERGRRYETANGLANDIRRHLAGEVVVAAPPSTAYRLHKFVRRNRGLVVATFAVAAALLVGVVGFAWQAEVAQRERDAAVSAQQAEAAQRLVADEQRALAERNKATADATNQFLIDMLGAANVRELGRDATVAQALEHAAAGAEAAFVDRPEVEAAIRFVVGHTYLSLGMLDEAAPEVDAAVELGLQIHGPESFEHIRSLKLLGSLRQLRGDDLGALEPFARAAEIATATVGAEAPLTLGIRSEYANVLAQLDRLAEAEAILREVVAERMRLPGQRGGDTLIAVNSLAVLLHRQGRLDEAEVLYHDALAIGEQQLGPQHPDTLTTRLNLASLLASRGKPAEAEPLMVPLVADLRRVFGPTSAKAAEAAKALGELYAAQGRYRDALPLFEDCVAIRTRAEGETSQGVAEAKSSLASSLRRLGDQQRASGLQREVVATFTGIHGADSTKAMNAALNLANGLGESDAAEAETIFRDVLARSLAALGESSTVHIVANNSYGVFLMGKGRFADAEPYVRLALQVGEEVEGPEHENTVITRHNLANIEFEIGNLSVAEQLGRECVDAFVRVFGPDHANLAIANSSLARTLARLGRNDEAERALETAIAIATKALGPQGLQVKDHMLSLARLLCDTGRAPRAEPMLREVVAVYTKARGPQDRRTANATVELGRCCQLLGRFVEGERLLLEGHAILVGRRSSSRSDIRLAERYLAAGYTAWHAAEGDSTHAAKASEWQARADSQ